MGKTPTEGLFELTERLTQIGRDPRPQPVEGPETERQPRTPFVRIVTESRPAVVPAIRRIGFAERTEAMLADAGMLTAGGVNAMAEPLANALRRVHSERLSVVYPRSLIERFEIEGVRLEPVDTTRVFTGAELILGPENRLIGPGERTLDPLAEWGGRCLDLYTLAVDGVQDPGRGLASARRRDGEWRLAWRLVPSDSVAGVSRSELLIEVALRVQLRDHQLSARGRYRVGGRHSEPGYHKAPEVNSFVVEVRSAAAGRGGTRAVFWLVGDSLDAAIGALNRQVAFAAIAAQGSGYVEH